MKALTFTATILLLICIHPSVRGVPFRILVFLPDKYGANYYLDRANFENYGWKITVAGTSQNIYPCPVYAAGLGCPVVHPDTLIHQIGSVSGWDAIVVMSGSYYAGNACGNLLASAHTLALVSHAADSGLVVGGFCTGVRVLAAANVINGKVVTGNPNYQSEYVAAGAIWAGKNKPPQIQENIVTCSAGDFFNIQNCAAILRTAASLGDHAKRNVTQTFKKVVTSSGVQWMRSSGTPESDGTRCIETTPGGESVIAGYTYAGNDKPDLLLMKLNANGVVTKSKQLEESGWQFAQDMVPDGTGGFMVTGYGEGPHGSFDVILINSDSNLDVRWQKYYGGTGFDVANSICRFSDGTYVISGYTESFGAGQDDFYLIRVDGSGDTLWTRAIGTSNSEMGFEVIETSDHHIAITGNSGTFPANGPGNRNARLLKLNMNGEIIWQKSYDTPGIEKSQEWGVGLIQTADGGFLIAGHHDITYEELKNGLLIKCDESGAELWRKSIGEGTFYDGLESIAEMDGKLYACGMTSSPGQGNDGYFVITDSAGDVIENEIIGDHHPQFLHEIKKSGTCNLIMTGQTWSSDSSYNAMTLKYQIENTTPVADNKTAGAPCKITVYPNPFVETITIETESPFTGEGRITLWNSASQWIGTSLIPHSSQMQSQVRISDLFPGLADPGFFIMEIRWNGCRVKKKLIYDR